MNKRTIRFRLIGQALVWIIAIFALVVFIPEIIRGNDITVSIIAVTAALFMMYDSIKINTNYLIKQYNKLIELEED